MISRNDKNRIISAFFQSDFVIYVFFFSLLYVSAIREYEDKVLWIQPLDEETPRQIADLGNEELGDFGLAVSPDGKSFAVVQGEWLHDAVLLKGLK